MVRATGSKVAGYECASCHWIQERTALPPHCHRCGKLPEWLIPLSRAELIGMIDAAEVSYCEACHKIHVTR